MFLPAVVQRHFDCCNAVLYGVSVQITHWLQMVLNTAAFLVIGASRRDHILPVLHDVLYWLPVTQRIQFKIAAAAFDCIHNIGPAYFKDVCSTVVNISSQANLCSAHRGDMFVPQTRMQLRRRGFHVAAPTAWNSLPLHLCSPSISRGQSRAGLKTHLFNQAYTCL